MNRYEGAVESVEKFKLHVQNALEFNDNITSANHCQFDGKLTRTIPSDICLQDTCAHLGVLGHLVA